MRDIDLFFQGPTKATVTRLGLQNVPESFFARDYSFHAFQRDAILAHLVYRAGCFASIGQAKKNGWNKPIPPGYSEHRVGKTTIHVLNAFQP